jgi:hypothetical protein
MKGEKDAQALAWTDFGLGREQRPSQAVRQASNIHYVVRVKLISE